MNENRNEVQVEEVTFSYHSYNVPKLRTNFPKETINTLNSDYN